MAVGDGRFGVGDRFGQAGRSENCCRHFKLIYVVFAPLLAPTPNFVQITIGRFWLVGLVGQKKVAATLIIKNL